MEIIELKDLSVGSAIQLYYRQGNINNQRCKVVHIGCEDGADYAVVKAYTPSKETCHLKIIYGYDWKIFPWYLIDTATEVDDWIMGDNQILDTVKAHSDGAR